MSALILGDTISPPTWRREYGTLITGVHSQALVRAAFAAGSSVASTAAAEILNVLRPATGYAAAALLAWEPRSNEHVVLANGGYEPQTLLGLGEPYAASEEHDRLRITRTALRIDDLPYDYRATEIFQTVLAPAGFDDGMTICLFARDGSYAGMLHMSAGSARTFGDESRDLLNDLAETVASVCDLRALRSPVPLPADCRASLIDSRGREWSLGDHDAAAIPRTPEFRAFLRRFLSGHRGSATGLLPYSGAWLEVRVDRVPDPMIANATAVLLIEVPGELPYGLSRREFDILNALALGHANQRIAFDRSISLRTVTTHVERILEKLGTGSRAGAAVKALDEGRLRLDLHSTEAGRTCAESSRASQAPR